jgi:hypothetical protein
MNISKSFVSVVKAGPHCNGVLLSFPAAELDILKCLVNISNGEQ